MAAQLRAAVVGSGGMGHTRASHLAHDARATVTCVSSRNHVTGGALADRHHVPFVDDWRAVVDRGDVDAVFVATHNDSHAAIARAALDAGKHVFVEYPLATCVEDADRLLTTARERGRVLHIGHDHALVGWHLAIKEQVSS